MMASLSGSLNLFNPVIYNFCKTLYYVIIIMSNQEMVCQFNALLLDILMTQVLLMQFNLKWKVAT
jgi:hypothetical protein